jgi:transcriptional regulator with XRE-family HTH domain
MEYIDMLYLEVSPNEFRQLRESLGLSHEEFAKRLDLSDSQIVRDFEAGKRTDCISAQLGTSSDPHNITISVALRLPGRVKSNDEGINLFNYEVEEAKSAALAIMREQKLPDAVKSAVLKRIQIEYDLSRMEINALAHRFQKKFLSITRDQVLDYVRDARRELNIDS